MQAYKAGEYDKAKKCFKKTIELDPGYARAYACLGNIAFAQTEYAEAEKFFRTAIEKDPDLKEKLLASLFTATIKKNEEEIKKRSVNLKKVYDLLRTDKVKLLEKHLASDISINLLIKERSSISFDELKELDKIVTVMSMNQNIAPRVKYFFACYLFERYITRNIAAVLMAQAAKDLTGEEKHKAYLKTGSTYKIIGRKEQAIIMYEKALEAGAPVEKAAQGLAKVYNMSAEEIIRQKKLSTQTTAYNNTAKTGIKKLPTSIIKIPAKKSTKNAEQQSSDKHINLNILQ